MYLIYLVKNKRNAIGLGQKGSCLTIILNLVLMKAQNILCKWRHRTFCVSIGLIVLELYCQTNEDFALTPETWYNNLENNIKQKELTQWWFTNYGPTKMISSSNFEIVFY